MREFSAGGQGACLCCCKEAWLYKRFNILDAKEMILGKKSAFALRTQIQT